MSNWKSAAEGAWKLGKGLWRTFDLDPKLVESTLRNTDQVVIPQSVMGDALDGDRGAGGFALFMHPSGTSTPHERAMWHHLEPYYDHDTPLRHQVSKAPTASWDETYNPDGATYSFVEAYDPFLDRPYGGSELFNIPAFDDASTGYSFGMSRLIPGKDRNRLITTPFLKDYVIKGREDEVAEWMQSMIRSDNPYDRHYFEFLQTTPDSKDYGPLLENLSLDDITIRHISPDNPMYPKPASIFAAGRQNSAGWMDHLIRHETLGHQLNAEISSLGLPYSEVGLRAFTGGRPPNPMNALIDETISQGVGYGGSTLNQVSKSLGFLGSPSSQRFYRNYYKNRPDVWDSNLHRNLGRGVLGASGLVAAAGTYPLFSKIKGYRDIEKTIEQKQQQMEEMQYPGIQFSRPPGFDHASDDLERNIGLIGSFGVKSLMIPFHPSDSAGKVMKGLRVIGDDLDFRAEDGTLPLLVPIDDPPGRRF
jgi:hypothetical protein